MSESKKEEKLEPFTICREDSPGGQSLPPGVLFEQRQCLVYFRVTERSWCRGPLQHLVAQSPKGVRNGGWVLRASTKGQRSEWVTSPVGLVWFLVLFSVPTHILQSSGSYKWGWPEGLWADGCTGVLPGINAISRKDENTKDNHWTIKSHSGWCSLSRRTW